MNQNKDAASKNKWKNERSLRVTFKEPQESLKVLLSKNNLRETSWCEYKARIRVSNPFVDFIFYLIVPDLTIFKSLKTGLKLAEYVEWALQGDGRIKVVPILCQGFLLLNSQYQLLFCYMNTGSLSLMFWACLLMASALFSLIITALLLQGIFSTKR